MPIKKNSLQVIKFKVDLSDMSKGTTKDPKAQDGNTLRRASLKLDGISLKRTIIRCRTRV